MNRLSNVNADAKILYRVEAYISGEIAGPGKYHIRLSEYEVIKETEQGYWIDLAWMMKRWVPKIATKAYARTTKRAAYEDFIARRSRQNRIIKNILKSNEHYISIAKENLAKYDQERDNGSV